MERVVPSPSPLPPRPFARVFGLRVLFVLACGQLLAGSLGCSDPDVTPTSPSVGPPGELVSALKPHRAAGAATSAPDRLALSEIIAHIPAASPPPTGSSLVGTKVPSAWASASASPKMPTLTLAPNLKVSSVATERALRSTFYFELVHQCRSKSGEVLPIDSVAIEFRVDPSGLIDRTSVRAHAEREEFAEAALCMARVIRTADPRFLDSRTAEPTLVRALVPSVD